MIRPDPELEQLLLLSPEARETRRADRLGELVVGSEMRLRGRTRPLYGEGLGLDYVVEFDNLEIQSLGRDLDLHSQPLFDQFTRGYRVAPNSESVNRYVTAANAKLSRTQLRGKTHEERQADMRRQTQHIADRLQTETFINMYLAQLWRTSLRTIKYQVQNQTPLDQHAAALSSDAIRDMGFCLLPQKFKGLENQPVNIKIGTKLIVFGELVFKDSELLRKFPDVLRLVRREQAKRDEYWGKRAEFLIKPSILGELRTKSTLEAHINVKHELARQVAILKNDPEAA